MMQRLRSALRGERSGEPANRQFRPNELRLDLVRAERLRRDARRAEPPSSQPGRALEELQARAPVPREAPAADPAIRPRPDASQIAALKTRTGLRQAWLLKEILAPPLALRDRYDDEHAR
jgi:hypothetical protein